MGCVHGYMAASGLDQYLKKSFPAALRPPLLALHAQSNRALHTRSLNAQREEQEHKDRMALEHARAVAN